MVESTIYFLIVGVLVIFLIILAVCWDKVEPTEYGLIYSSISKKVDPRYTYEGGRYLLFFTNSFVTFPKTVVNIEFVSNTGYGVFKALILK